MSPACFCSLSSFATNHGRGILGSWGTRQTRQRRGRHSDQNGEVSHMANQAAFLGRSFRNIIGGLTKTGILPKVPCRLCDVFSFFILEDLVFGLVFRHAVVSANVIETAIALLWSVFRKSGVPNFDCDGSVRPATAFDGWRSFLAASHP
jgi:hypothetical protein